MGNVVRKEKGRAAMPAPAFPPSLKLWRANEQARHSRLGDGGRNSTYPISPSTEIRKPCQARL
jgi:hypothetical protein